MSSYIRKPHSIKKSQILSKELIFSPSRYKYVEIKNSDKLSLEDFIEQSTDSHSLSNKKGFYQYVEIGDINTLTGNINYKTVRSIDPSSSSVYKLKKDDILISTVRTYLGGIGYVLKDDNNIVCTKALIVLRKSKTNKSKYYLFGVLRTKFFISQVSIILNASMYPRMEKSYFKDLFIPLPTKKNNKNPKVVEELVANLIQNILDKEENIKLKNDKIDDEIQKELEVYQKPSSFHYDYPCLSEIKTANRMDTSIFSDKYKKEAFTIYNYVNGYFYLNPKNVSPGRTPKDYYFSDNKKNDMFFEWVTPKNIERRQLSSRTYIHTKSKTKVKKYSLIINGIRYVGNGIFVNGNKPIYTNQNTLIINSTSDKTQQLFLLCFLTSRIGKFLQTKQRNFGIVPILYKENLCKIPIPNFPPEKQKEIIRHYYNPKKSQVSLNARNYLTKEKARNNKLGIFQLNDEIYALKDKLEDIVKRIITNKTIKIDYHY